MAIRTATLEQDVARASLIHYQPTRIQILVVAAKAGEWRKPQPENELFEAYVEGSGVEAYLIAINSRKRVQPQEPSTWEGLQGRIMEALYSPNVPNFIPKHAATNHPRPKGRLVEIPASILEAAGICRQGAFNVSPLSLEHSLSPEDLAYVRNNCIRETR